ncbi:MAG: hypothetical protein ACO3UU_05850, partial [Minisyncoccia bacterium]
NKEDVSRLANDANRDKYKEYVEMIFRGVSKEDAYKECFPAEWIEIKDKSKNIITKTINKVDNSKIVQDMYSLVHKHWWKDFIVKKQDIFSNLYGMAMNEDIAPRDRISASKTLLQHIPEAPTEININSVVEHKISFEDKLKDMQRKLYKTANNIDEEIIDVTVVKETV